MTSDEVSVEMEAVVAVDASHHQGEYIPSLSRTVDSFRFWQSYRDSRHSR